MRGAGPRALHALLVGLLALTHAASAQEPATAADPVDDRWFAGPALADRDGEGKDWSVDITPYAWLINVDGKVGIAGTQQFPISQTFASIRSNLEGAFAGTLDARWRRWHLLVDGSWAGLSDNVAPALPIPGPSSVDVDLDMAFGTVGVGYELPVDLGFAWDVYLGARWWSVEVQAQSVPALVPGLGPQTQSESWGDVVVGTRLRYAITDKWRVTFLGDVGGGASRVDWQIFGGLGYDFNRYVGLTAGYRILGVNYNRGGFIYDTTQQGLLLGLRLGF
jgi:hypothetical protein